MVVSLFWAPFFGSLHFLLTFPLWKTPLSRHFPFKSPLFCRFSLDSFPSFYFFCSFLWESLHAANAVPMDMYSFDPNIFLN